MRKSYLLSAESKKEQGPQDERGKENNGEETILGGETKLDKMIDC